MPTRAQIRQAAEKLLEQTADRANQLLEQAVDTAEVLRERAASGAAKLGELAAHSTGVVLEHAAEGARDASEALQRDVPGHMDRAEAHLTRHAQHEQTARRTGEPAHPDSQLERDAGGIQLLVGLGKYAAAKTLPHVADLLEAGAQRLNPQDTDHQEPQALPPAPDEE